MPKCLLCRRDEHSAVGNKGLITGFRVCGLQITSALLESEEKRGICEHRAALCSSLSPRARHNLGDPARPRHAGLTSAEGVGTAMGLSPCSLVNFTLARFFPGFTKLPRCWWEVLSSKRCDPLLSDRLISE